MSEALAIPAGTCVDAFDADGFCTNDALPWVDVTQFATDEENATAVPRKEFLETAHGAVAIANGRDDAEFRFLRTADGLLMLHDTISDVHHFYVGAPAPSPGP